MGYAAARFMRSHSPVARGVAATRLGIKPQGVPAIRQKAAQISALSRPRLVTRQCRGSVHLVEGDHYVAASTDLPIPTPSLRGQACDNFAGLLVFSFRPAGLLNRQGSAQRRFTVRNCLHGRVPTGFVPLSDNYKKQGWAGCEQRKSSPQLRFARALRRAAKQPANRHYMAREQACLALSSSMETRSSGLSQGLRPTSSIARLVRAIAADPLGGSLTQNNRLLSGPTTHAQITVAGHMACSGFLCLSHPKSKDTSCSKRS